MNVTDAIKTLTKAKKVHSQRAGRDFVKALDIAISALEKQILKKATEETINRGIDISGEYDIDFNLCCPSCGGVVGTFEGEEDEYFSKYCPNCGQALDWSDTE